MFDIIFLLPFMASMGLFSFYTSKSVRSLINEYRLYPERKKRDIHTELVPSSIGVGFLIVFTCGTIFYQNEFLNVIDYSALIISAAGITVLGYLDDLNALSSKRKLFFQIVCICLFLYFNQHLIVNNLHFFLGITEISFTASIMFTVFIGIIMINGLNLIDGIDGFAAIISMVCSSLFALIFWGIGSTIPFLMSILIVVITAGYLPVNISKTKKGFMGDSGSMFLGYIFFIFTLILLQSDFTFIYNIVKTESVIPLAALSIYIIPILDTLSIYYYRFSIGKKPLSADNFHIHHMMLHYVNPNPIIVSLITGVFVVVFCTVMSIVTFLYSGAIAISIYFTLLFLIVTYVIYYKSKMRLEIGDTNGNIEKVD
jgi:UDP-N-acetylmuramyl pentapeptide phosphotransferase/UDP-N-acetylglucosamine-1-phosphate transferase